MLKEQLNGTTVDQNIDQAIGERFLVLMEQYLLINTTQEVGRVGGSHNSPVFNYLTALGLPIKEVYGTSGQPNATQLRFEEPYQTRFTSPMPGRNRIMALEFDNWLNSRHKENPYITGRIALVDLHEFKKSLNP